MSCTWKGMRFSKPSKRRSASTMGSGVWVMGMVNPLIPVILSEEVVRFANDLAVNGPRASEARQRTYREFSPHNLTGCLSAFVFLHTCKGSFDSAAASLRMTLSTLNRLTDKGHLRSPLLR